MDTDHFWAHYQQEKLVEFTEAEATTERYGVAMYFEKLCAYLSELPEVESIALRGSRAGARYDEKSDYDLYVYEKSPLSEETRLSILKECCSYIELGNHFWELEDNCTLKDGVDIDILHRNLDAFSKDISSVVVNHVAHNGYTTCMWHNLLHSKILFDREGKFRDLQEKYSVPYPAQLKKNIIERNMRLLSGNLPSYDKQIIKALKRNDTVSVNHRTAAYMESYFDIIFAMNELTHPGEKRMVQIALEQAAVLPQDFEKNLTALYQDLFAYPQNVEHDIVTLTENLKLCLSTLS